MAYDNGDYFRFDRDRLREYHYREDTEPFAHRGNNPGAHRSGLFTELFPAEISRQLKSFVGKKDCLVQFFPDVANDVYDGTSAIMLSGESAAGKYPVEAVATMAQIAEFTEQHTSYKERFYKNDFRITWARRSVR